MAMVAAQLLAGHATLMYLNLPALKHSLEVNTTKTKTYKAETLLQVRKTAGNAACERGTRS